MKIITLTETELEAVRWAVGNFENGNADDCDGKARYEAMKSAYEKLTAAQNANRNRYDEIHRKNNRRQRRGILGRY